MTQSTIYKHNIRLDEGDDDDDDDNPEEQPATRPEDAPMFPGSDTNAMSMWARKSDELFYKRRAVYLWGAVTDTTAKDVVNKLLLLDADKPGEEIRFFINSPGGVVTSGMVMYDVIKMIKSPVSTICMGLAASMGSILLSAGVKGRRFIFPHGEVMIHQPSLGGYMQGVSADLEIQAIQIAKTKELGGKILAENCGQDFEKVMRDLERDYWMDAQESIKYGIVDGVLDKLDY